MNVTLSDLQEWVMKAVAIRGIATLEATMAEHEERTISSLSELPPSSESTTPP